MAWRPEYVALVDDLPLCAFCHVVRPYADPSRPAVVGNRERGERRSIGKTLGVDYIDQARVGDHICNISDLRRLRADYPEWDLGYGLDKIFQERSAG